MPDSFRHCGVQPARLLCPWDSPGKNTGVGTYSLLQGIFTTRRSKPDLQDCRQILYHLSHQGNPFQPLYLAGFPGKGRCRPTPRGQVSAPFTYFMGSVFEDRIGCGRDKRILLGPRLPAFALPPFPSLPQSDAPPGDLWPFLWERDVFWSPRSGFELGQSRAPWSVGRDTEQARICLTPPPGRFRLPLADRQAALAEHRFWLKEVPPCLSNGTPASGLKPQMGKVLYNPRTPPRNRE